ncbi:helix-turn-helix domain-containing protein [Yoonia sp. I 8.24]|uniref:helix-turn-helix domain-containing protein n=1 Tax=Yoonia sp. I 8.24 TaxID=1537229 RepID=UPI001EDCEE22|nr:helix-turn-helix domain-containing protein [Yoonia sp. I 8.24]MCG3267481.1 helix-turn-helix domain-containing protein [Yoonia sp. I 8.24]
MIGKTFKRSDAAQDAQTKGFDDFELRLGDLMRGERATMGKSLLDVQRELKIKAAYIAAIENADPSAFDTPGFIAGYVRSYARYLRMDPDYAFDTFCTESGFATAHGMSAEASSLQGKIGEPVVAPLGKDIFSASATPFVPAADRVMAGFEPRAIGSVLVLIAMIGGLGFGGWTVLQEVQKVQFAPVEQAPVVVADLDPLSGVTNSLDQTQDLAGFVAPSSDALDRLYRPQALDVPVLTARDAPISTLNPGSFGSVLPAQINPDVVVADADVASPHPPAIQVVGPDVPELQLVAVRPAWVRVRAANGTVIFEGVMSPGENFEVPATEEPATLRVGESGAVYFAVNGVHYGPAGQTGVVTSNVALNADSLLDSYSVADLTADDDLAEVVRVAENSAGE